MSTTWTERRTAKVAPEALLHRQNRVYCDNCAAALPFVNSSVCLKCMHLTGVSETVEVLCTANGSEYIAIGALVQRPLGSEIGISISVPPNFDAGYGGDDKLLAGETA